MPKPVVTSRELKNKESGIDLYVTSYSVQKGLMSNVVHYQVVLVSNLACFKTASHKEHDVVQYSVEKLINEFEDLHASLTEMFPNTVLPVINKKSFIVNDQVLRERRNSLDQLMRFIASIPKLAMSVPLLQFLGVDPLRAKKFSIGEPLETTPAQSSIVDDEDETATGADVNVDFLIEKTDEDEDVELFKEEEDYDQEKVSFGDNKALMFEEQDLKRELTEDDEKDFQFLPDAIIKKKETIKVYAGVDDDHSDLFKIDDDLDQLLTIDVGKKRNKSLGEQGKEISESNLGASPTKPPTPTKPQIPTKPALPDKPQVAAKPKTACQSPKDPSSRSADGKPAIAAKPKPSASAAQVGATGKAEVKPPGADSESLGQDDILKYLQENLATAAEDVDLFS